MPTIVASTQAPVIKNYIRGDSRLLNITILQSDGVTPFNLTGCEVFFTLNLQSMPPNSSTDASAALATSTSTFTNPTSGVAQIQLTNAQTQPLTAGTYYYDVQLKDASGNITSLAQNQFIVITDITTRIT